MTAKNSPAAVLASGKAKLAQIRAEAHARRERLAAEAKKPKARP